MDVKHFNENVRFRVERVDNDTFVATAIHQPKKSDDVGALYYVVVVILIYGCSILMMIASYIRKNKMDRKLNRYLKEMANVRKRERQMQLMAAAAKAREHRESLAGHAVLAAKLSTLSRDSSTEETAKSRVSNVRLEPSQSQEGTTDPFLASECSSTSVASTSRGSKYGESKSKGKKGKENVKLLNMPNFVKWNLSPRFGRKKAAPQGAKQGHYLNIPQQSPPGSTQVSMSHLQNIEAGEGSEQDTSGGYQVISTV